MTDREALKLAFEALKDMNCGWKYIRESHGDLYGVGWDRAQGKADDAIEALRQALEQPAQEPVAWGFQNTAITGSNRWMYLRETIPTNDQYRGVLWTPLYTSPPKRECETCANKRKRLEQSGFLKSPLRDEK